MTKHDDRTQIRNVIDDWAAGLRAKDAKRVIGHGADDLVHFSLPLHKLPLADENGLYGLQKWFDTWDGPLGYEVSDLEITSSDGVAFSHSLNHLSGTKTSGDRADLWFRSTLGFRKIGGEWKIVHEHESVPFLMDGSDKAALDPKP